jgi:hypothetical protein
MTSRFDSFDCENVKSGKKDANELKSDHASSKSFSNKSSLLLSPQFPKSMTVKQIAGGGAVR